MCIGNWAIIVTSIVSLMYFDTLKMMTFCLLPYGVSMLEIPWVSHRTKQIRDKEFQEALSKRILFEHISGT